MRDNFVGVKAAFQLGWKIVTPVTLEVKQTPGEKKTSKNYSLDVIVV